MQRAAGVTIIAILGFILGGLATLEGLLTFVRGEAIFAWGRSFYAGGGLIALLLLCGGILVIVTSVGLLKLRQWARILAIVLNAAHLVLATHGLLDTFRGTPSQFLGAVVAEHIVMLAIGVWIIVCLFQPAVSQAFRAPASAAS